MALMEYCLVNVVLGDSDAPKPPPDPNAGKVNIFKNKKQLFCHNNNTPYYILTGQCSVYKQPVEIKS